jgi:hypothetical protein
VGSLDDVVQDRGDQQAGEFLRFRQLLAVHEACEQEIVHPRATHELADGYEIVAGRLEEERG